MKNLIFTVAAFLAFSQAFAQTNPGSRDTLTNGKRTDTTLTNTGKRNTVKEASKPKDHTKVTRKNKAATSDTTATKTRRSTR